VKLRVLVLVLVLVNVNVNVNVNESWADPVADTDGDGTSDSADHCPAIIGAPPDGCPPRDTDGDGILDGADACPSDPGPRARRGCPQKAGATAAELARAKRLPAPRLVGGRRGVLSADARKALRAAGAELARAGARRVVVVSVADHGLSYGDSIERARRAGELAAQLLRAQLHAPVSVDARGPDGAPRLELRY